MEGMALLGMAVLVVGVLAYYNVFGSVETAADMANTELREAKRQQTLRIAKKYKDIELHEDQWAASIANIEKLDNLKL